MSSVLEINVYDLKRMSDILLVDCRRPEEWDICYIPGAILCPLQDLTKYFSLIRERAGNRRVIVYCHTGRRSLVAAYQLREVGIDAVSLRGGIDAWSDIDMSVARY